MTGNATYDRFGQRSYIDSVHRRIHDGQVFVNGYFWSESVSTGTPLADNACAVLLTKPGRAMHIIHDISVSGESEIYLYKGVSTGTTETGTAVTALNLNDFSDNVSGAYTIYGSSGIIASITSTAVTAYPGKLLPGGSGGNAIGAQDGSYGHELNWQSGETYALLVRNRSGGISPTSILQNYYEPAASTST